MVVMTPQMNRPTPLQLAVARSAPKPYTLNRKRLGALVGGLVTLASLPQAGAAEKPVRGKDRIDIPAIGHGLCLHQLFQTRPTEKCTRSSSIPESR